MNNRAIHGNNSAAMCSLNRRMGTDHPASNKWCTSTRKSAPRHRLRQNMKASSQEKANWRELAKYPASASAPPPIIRIPGRFRHLERSRGLGVADLVLALMAAI